MDHDVEEFEAALALLQSQPISTNDDKSAHFLGAMLEAVLEEEQKPSMVDSQPESLHFSPTRKRKAPHEEPTINPNSSLVPQTFFSEQRSAKKRKKSESAGLVAVEQQVPASPEPLGSLSPEITYTRSPDPLSDYESKDGSLSPVNSSSISSGTIPNVTHTDRPYKCTFEGCNVSFALKSNLTVHYRIHTGEKPYKCSYEGCNAVFRHKSSLNQHLKTHTGERPHKCTHKGCNAAFIQKHHLTIHYRTHTGDRPFKCTFPGCTSTFVAKSALVSHHRTHSGGSSVFLDAESNEDSNDSDEVRTPTKAKSAKVFRCKHPNCNASFTIKSGLTIHERTHSGDRPFKCTYEGCNASFSAKSALTKHSKRHL